MKNDRRTIFGWAMYDWANSAYSTTIASAVLPALFAEEIVPDTGYEVFGRVFSGETLWAAVVGVGALLLFLATPVLGAIADFSATRRRFLIAFATIGSLASAALALMGPGDVALTLAVFLVAQMGFVGANVFYDGFLPAIATDDTIDRVSSQGYALGYIGGGLQLLLAALVILFHGSLGLTEIGAARIGIAMAGVWWFGFGWYAFSMIPEVGSASPLPDRYAGLPRIAAYAAVGFRRTAATARRLVGFKHLALFLLAFMFFNDGIQTVINLSAVYAADTLDLSAATILGALLVVQFVAYVGALAFGWLAGRVGPKPALMASLVAWIAAAIAAFAVPAGAVAAFYAVAAFVGFILGGAQALARSLYGSMIPEEASAEFYGFYAVFAKFSAIWGPLIFAVISGATGSGRPAILSIVVFFVIGLALVARVDVEEARASRSRWAFDEDGVRAADGPG